jgi:malate dehydrogenase (oxaloacetate-decarboxylating)
MDYNKLALEMHKKYQGKISVESKVEVASKDDLSTAYTPGVAEPCREIHKNKEAVYDYTAKGNMVAVVSDGTAVLGLGDIGPEAAMPVMEGKAVLFKKFGNVDAFPICLDTKDVDEIVRTIQLMAPTFGGVNLEDIAAPRCFEIERKLKEVLDIPVFHDDQHGTAIVVVAGVINALKLSGKSLSDVEVVVNGAGSAGIAIAKLILSVGVKNLVLCDINGALHAELEGMNPAQVDMTKVTNKNNETGSLADVLSGKDVFIGVSAPNIVSADMISKMNEKAVVFAMANPVPEIMPDEAKKGGAFIVGTGRSDFANQVNNVLAFPGIFRGALDVRASDINEAMKLAAAYAIAETLTDDELAVDNIIPKAFDPRVGQNVASAVAKAAQESGIARK